MTEKPPEKKIIQINDKINKKSPPEDTIHHTSPKQKEQKKPDSEQSIFLSGMRTRKIRTHNGHNSLENLDDFFREFMDSCSESDQDFARMLLSQNRINIFQLKEILDLQKKFWLEKKSLLLEDILLEQGLLQSQEISFLKNEAETKKIPALLPFLESKEVVANKYHILEKTGSDYTGVVYKVEYLMQCRQIFSLKIMHPIFSFNNKNISACFHELQEAKELKHPNILSIVEFGILPNQAIYILTEYSSGKSLKTILKDHWKWDITRSLRITQQILIALLYAHSFSIFHAQLNPSNIFLENGIYNHENIKITDFGLSKIMEKGEVSFYDSPETMLYMSPEQICKGKIDQRSDLYTIATLFYEMLTGQPMFEAKNLSDMLFKQVFTKPNPPGKINPLVPRALDRIILKALEKEPERRFQSAEEFLAALENIKNPHIF